MDEFGSGPVSTSARDLTGWLGDALGPGVPVTVVPPHGSTVDVPAGVWIRPVRLLVDQAIRGGAGRVPLRLRVRYAVAVTGTAPTALDLLDRILLALAGTDRYRPVPDESPAEPWPTLTLDVPVRVDAPTRPVRRVESGLRLAVAQPRTVHGRLVGPGGTPLPGMTVAAPGTGARVRTDAQGRFALPGQPTDRAVALHLSGRGLRLRVDVAPRLTEPIEVTCDPAATGDPAVAEPEET